MSEQDVLDHIKLMMELWWDELSTEARIMLSQSYYSKKQDVLA